MLSDKPLVCIGMLGPTLDSGTSAKRWEKWRPTVSLFQHDDLLIDRIELLHQERFQQLADTVVADIERLSPQTEVVTHNFEVENPWDLEECYDELYAFARNYPFDLESESYLIHITTGTHVLQIVEFLLVESGVIPGRLIQTAPPNRRSKSEGRFTVIDLDLSRYDRVARRFAQEEQESQSFLKAGVATRNSAFNTLIEKIETVTLRSSKPILLTGPTGAGKTQLARRIYALKHRKNSVRGAFVEVNCATLRGAQAMSALFGHTKGAFTGAASKRDGLLKSADGGMLFLDEIGELGLDEQAMLLRAIESKTFLPVGSDRETSSDFQLIAGTNRDLREAVRKGDFREDLLARIDLWTFQLPALKERIEDLEPNIDFELKLFEKNDGDVVRFNKEARQKYLRFAKDPTSVWSANFRDLNASMTRMATLAPGKRIDVETVQQEIERLRSDWRYDTPVSNADQQLRDLIGDRIDELDRFDRVQLADVLQVCLNSKNMSDAGRRLFAVSRAEKDNPNDSDRIRKYLKRHRLTWNEIERFRVQY